MRWIAACVLLFTISCSTLDEPVRRGTVVESPDEKREESVEERCLASLKPAKIPSLVDRPDSTLTVKPDLPTLPKPLPPESVGISRGMVRESGCVKPVFRDLSTPIVPVRKQEPPSLKSASSASPAVQHQAPVTEPPVPQRREGAEREREIDQELFAAVQKDEYPLESREEMVSPVLERTIRCYPGEELSLQVPGAGWIFLSADEEGSERGSGEGLHFLGRNYLEEGMLFQFAVEREGTWLLRLQRQSSESGGFEYKNYLLRTSAQAQGAEGEAVLAHVPKEDEGMVPLDEGLRLYREDRRRQALSLLSEQLPSLESGEALKAFTIYESPRAEDLAGDLFSDRALRQYRRLAQGDEAPMVHFIEWLLPASSGNERAELCFLLGQWYQSESEPRDYRRAAELFRSVRLRHPWSPRWKAAGERERYLKRYYLELR